eukprot:Tbor_TRINITY_DN4065_c0_g1::TRINITY_DN4065_c0_g1_i1::g.11717::m.11717
MNPGEMTSDVRSTFRICAHITSHRDSIPCGYKWIQICDEVIPVNTVIKDSEGSECPLGDELAGLCFSCPEFGTSVCVVVGKDGTDKAITHFLRILALAARESNTHFSSQLLASSPNGSIAYEAMSGSDILTNPEELVGTQNITYLLSCYGSKLLYILVVTHLTPSCVALLQTTTYRQAVIQIPNNSRDHIEAIEDIRRIGNVIDENRPPLSTTQCEVKQTAVEELRSLCRGLARSDQEHMRALELIDKISTSENGGHISNNKYNSRSNSTSYNDKVLNRPSSREEDIDKERYEKHISELQINVNTLRNEALHLVQEFQQKEKRWQTELKSVYEEMNMIKESM